MKNAIVLCSDTNYFVHACALFGSLRCRNIAGDAQLVLMADSTVRSEQLELCRQKNIGVIKTSDYAHCFHLKYSVFNPQLSIYDKIVYLDADIAIIKDNQDIFSDFDDLLGIDYEPFSLYDTLVSAAPSLSAAQITLLESLPNRSAWNAGGFIYRGSILTDELEKEIQDTRERYKTINYHVRGVQDGSDQPILNIALAKYNPVQSNLFAYWKKVTAKTVFAHCCADPLDRPWNNRLFKDQYQAGLRYFYEN